MGKLIRLEFITHLAALLVGGLLFGALGWFFQEARLGADVADVRLEAAQKSVDVMNEKIAGVYRVLNAERFTNGKLQTALNQASVRERALRADRDALQHSSVSLQQQLEEADRRIAEADPAAVREYASALKDVFGQCQREYGWLAEKADGHASDVQTCHAAWPAFGPEQVRPVPDPVRGGGSLWP